MDESLVLCLSEAWDIIPMWSYYARSHAGFVIGVDSTHSFFSAFALKPVKYSVEYPEVNYGVLLAEAYFHKFDQWKHEREWRCVRLLGLDGGIPYTHPTRKSADSNSCPEELTNVHLYSLPPEVIREVVFGHRMSDADRMQILTHLKTDAYRHVDLYNALPDKNAWRLERQRLEPT